MTEVPILQKPVHCFAEQIFSINSTYQINLTEEFHVAVKKIISQKYLTLVFCARKQKYDSFQQ